MKTLRFEGYSDDTFGEYAITNEDFDNSASGKPIEVLIEADGDSMLVVGQYCPGAASGWLIGVARADEDDDRPLPPWPVRLGPGTDRPYTVALYVDVPEPFTLHFLQNRGDE